MPNKEQSGLKIPFGKKSKIFEEVQGKFASEVEEALANDSPAIRAYYFFEVGLTEQAEREVKKIRREK
jgi:hypothetical protein